MKKGIFLRKIPFFNSISWQNHMSLNIRMKGLLIKRQRLFFSTHSHIVHIAFRLEDRKTM